MTNFGRKVAYQSTRNFLCAQIAYIKEKLPMYAESEISGCTDELNESLEVYVKILEILRENRKKIIEG